MSKRAPEVYADVRRVLIYRLGSLGDTVVALPALHQIARAFPNAQRIVLTNWPVHAKAPASSAVIGDSGLVHGYMNYPVGTRSAARLASLWWKIARFRAEWLIYLTPNRGSAALLRDRVFFRSAGIRHIAGLPAGDLARHMIDPVTGIAERESARLLRTIPQFGSADYEDLSLWNMHLTPAEKSKAGELLKPLSSRPFIACGIGTKMQAKDWGQENWRKLISDLGRKLEDFGLVLVGAEEDSESSVYASAEWPGPVVNLCGKLTPRETSAVLADAACFLGPDSGPMHLAAANGVPCVIAFASRVTPGIWFPVGRQHKVIYHKLPCSGCALTTCIERQRACLTSISVEEMLDATLSVIQSRTILQDTRRPS